MKNRYFTIEEIVSLPTLKNPVINSVGSMVAYVKVNADWDDNEFRSQVWIYDVEKDFSYPVTGFKTESSMHGLQIRRYLHIFQKLGKTVRKRNRFLSSVPLKRRQFR